MSFLFFSDKSEFRFSQNAFSATFKFVEIMALENGEKLAIYGQNSANLGANMNFYDVSFS